MSFLARSDQLELTQTSKGGIPCYKAYWNANDRMLQDETVLAN